MISTASSQTHILASFKAWNRSK